LASSAGGGLDAGAVVGQLVGGGIGGAVLTIIVGAVKNMMASKPTLKLLRAIARGYRDTCDVTKRGTVREPAE
jgi:hypothetical protein